MQTVQVLIRNQERFINESSQRKQDSDDRFYLNIHKMEYERVKYVLKSYLRTRLAKIERNLLYLIEKDKAILMSEDEIMFAAQLDQQRKTYLNETFGEKIPAVFNPFNEESDLPDKFSKFLVYHLIAGLVTAPNTEEFVFVRMLTAMESYEIMQDINVQILKNQVYFLPYRHVK